VINFLQGTLDGKGDRNPLLGNQTDRNPEKRINFVTKDENARKRENNFVMARK